MSQQASNHTPSPRRGVVKQVLSGDCVIIRGQARNGPPPERTFALGGITTPKLARRANPNVEGSVDTKDEPYAWEAREYLRKLVVGKEVSFIVEYTTNTKREYGTMTVNVDGEDQSVIDLLLSEGLAEVRQTGRESEEVQRLTALEAAAKSAGKGRWETEGKPVTRDITWNMSNDALRSFVQRNSGKEIDAVIEHVRDGSIVRAILLPSYTTVTVAMSGIKCPSFKRDGDKETPEPFAEPAKYFTESRLLQQDVKLLIEGVSNQLVLATIIHPEAVQEMYDRHYNKMATRIQSTWKGYHVRKYVFNYSAYKEYMVNLVKTNETVLAKLKQEREKAAEERLNREEKIQEMLLEREARRHHYMLSTMSQDGVFKSQHCESFEKTMTNMRFLPPADNSKKKIPKLRTFKDTFILPPLVPKPKVQGPFRAPEEVWKQRKRPLSPSLRVSTDYDSKEIARAELKAAEWRNRVIDKKFLPFSIKRHSYQPSLHTQSSYMKPAHGSKTFRTEKPINKKNFRTVVPPIPIFEKLNQTY